MMKTRCMGCILFFGVIAGLVGSVQPGYGQLTLACDFASPASCGEPMHYHWHVSNRISPMRRFNQPVGENPLINVVRPLGGKSRNGKKLTDEDTYTWDGQKYSYDWAPLKKQIDTVRARARLYQLLIDNPPWAFQRGLDFEGGKDVETYGNAWPPNDPEAWARYIRAMLRELVASYGRASVEQWRYCIGREIGTEGHWRAGKQAFFDHYRNTEQAIRSVLPNAQVGTHFLWASSKHSFGPDFVTWCRQHGVRYDFVGVSFYPFYKRIKRVDLEHVYRVDFAPIKDIPEWRSAATLELHEFALISSMSARGNSFENAPRAHQESFTVMLAKMMYEHDMVNVFRWGTGKNKAAEQAFLPMEGLTYFRSSKHGEPAAPGNMIDAVFARDPSGHRYDIMVYNYNAKPEPLTNESIRIAMIVPVSPGTRMRTRTAQCEGSGLEWSPWREVKTSAGRQADQSRLDLRIESPSFSFQKIELRAPGTP